MKTKLLLVIAALASILAPGAWAQGYPNKPIRLIVPFSPGGGTDTQARAIAQRLSQSLGQTVVVDNRPGAGGSIGAEIVVNAEPDGYTLIMVSGSYGANAALYKLRYDPIADIQPIALIGTTGLVLEVHPAVPAKSVAEFIAHAKANPGKLNFGSAGTGGLGHLAGEVFKLETQINAVHVPYKGSGPTMTALLSGEVQFSFSSMVPSIPHIRAGRLRGLGVTTAERSPALPDVPTIGETVPGYEVTHWYGLWGPKGLPKPILTRWNRDVAQVLQLDDVQKRLGNEGMVPGGGSVESFEKFLQRQVEKWRKVVKEANIKLG
ncbi:MAG: tripartite tricarboxylate transporter substrate binding protein [Betaproteobacteria bacterium]|nr:tripartite tricarboxylate transporter substrate binding protein [Betaproteobacteria bacterium]